MNASAQSHLAAHDPVMARLIAEHGPFTAVPHAHYYQELVEAIIGQQLSVKAAATIRDRFVALFGGTFPDPQQILARDVDTLRTAGLSRAKALYVQDLARHIRAGTVKINQLDRFSNDEIIAELTAVKGIGVWTVHMFLIFALGRLDVLPVGDLGLRTGLMRLYQLDALPDPATCRAVADEHGWHPYESVATWYVWRSLGNAPKVA